MSVTRHLVCIDCKQYIWIGQGNTLYSSGEYIEKLKNFLFLEHPSCSRSAKHHILSVDEHEYDDGLLANCTEVR